MNAKLEYSNRDVVAARTFAEEIKKVLKAHARGARNDAMLQDLKVLCICLIHTIRDPYCQEKMCEVAIHADAMWGRSSAPLTSIFMRRLIFKSLDAFDERLGSLETRPQSDRGAFGRNAPAGIFLQGRTPV